MLTRVDPRSLIPATWYSGQLLTIHLASRQNYMSKSLSLAKVTTLHSSTQEEAFETVMLRRIPDLLAYLVGKILGTYVMVDN